MMLKRQTATCKLYPIIATHESCKSVKQVFSDHHKLIQHRWKKMEGQQRNTRTVCLSMQYLHHQKSKTSHHVKIIFSKSAFFEHNNFVLQVRKFHQIIFKV